MKSYPDSVLDFVHDCYMDTAWKEKPEPMTAEDARYNLACMREDECLDVPECLTSESFMDIWNHLVLHDAGQGA